MTIARSPSALCPAGRSPISRSTLALAFAAAAWLGATPAQAFWCEGRLVLVGDSMGAIRDACGEPASATVRVETRSYCSCCAGGVHRGAVYAGGYGGGYGGGVITTTTTTIDVWVYDFGYTRFMEQLEFEGGILRRSIRLGRGSRTRRDRVERRIEVPAPGVTVWRRDLRVF